MDAQITEIGDPHYDDPSLALLFSQLKSKTLQTAQGTSEISGRTEFNFVLQTARVFCKMGMSLIYLRDERASDTSSRLPCARVGSCPDMVIRETVDGRPG